MKFKILSSPSELILPVSMSALYHFSGDWYLEGAVVSNALITLSRAVVFVLIIATLLNSAISYADEEG